MEPLNDWYFPVAFINHVQKNKLSINSVTDTIQYKDNICHRCVTATPMRTFRNSLIMPHFKKWYGWYIIISFLEAGILPETFVYLPERVNMDLKVQMSFEFKALEKDLRRYEEIENLNKNDILEWLDAMDKDYQIGEQRVLDRQYPENFIHAVAKALESRYSGVNRVIENGIRKSFGYRVMSGQWSSENKLTEMVTKLFSDYTILQHYRPGILEGLEIDIFIKELNWGIEYQGIQHYQPMEHFGGQRALDKTMERDAKKKELCESNGIKLAYFYYDEELTEELIRERLNDAFMLDDDNTYETEDPNIMGLLKMADAVNRS